MQLWEELITPEDEGLRASRAFPLLVGRALEWLRGAPALVPELRAGSSLAASLAPEDHRAVAPSARLALPAAGAAASSAGDLAVSTFLPENPTPSGAAAAALPAPELDGEAAWGLGTWVLLLALALLLLEERFLRLGRMP